MAGRKVLSEGWRGVRLACLGVLVSLLVCCLFATSCGSAASALEKPNFVVFVTDDLDAGLIEQRLRDLRGMTMYKGVTFTRAYATTPMCCPSRSTIFTGEYAHNHGVRTNTYPTGGERAFRTAGNESLNLAVRLRQAGYATGLFGKYLNEYDSARIPPGWNEWHAWVGGIGQNRMNDNGRIVDHGRWENNLADSEHHTDMVTERATDFINRAAAGKPLFLYIADKAPHGPAAPANRHKRAFDGVALPKPPSYNEADVSDKPLYIRDNRPLTLTQQAEQRKLYERRLESMLSVEDQVRAVLKALEENRELSNTYLIFISDNGYHIGEHRQPPGKGNPYVEDARVTFTVRGPGVPQGVRLPHTVGNLDIAPTVLDLAGAQPLAADGRSLRPLLRSAPLPESSWRHAILLEGWTQPDYRTVVTDRWWYTEYNTGEKELYDGLKDPYQLRNVYESTSPAVRDPLVTRLASLRDCSNNGCRNAEDAPIQ